MSADAAPERFARHALIPGWSQPRLASRTVVIAGMGAQGGMTLRELG
jgi:hypothetical protein